MKRLFWLIPAGLLLAALAGHAATQAPAAKSTSSASATMSLPKPPVPKFKQADTNQDGKISWQEAKRFNVPKKLFQHDDFDNNGSLNQTEWMFIRLDMTDFTPPKSGSH